MEDSGTGTHTSASREEDEPTLSNTCETTSRTFQTQTAMHLCECTHNTTQPSRTCSLMLSGQFTILRLKIWPKWTLKSMLRVRLSVLETSLSLYRTLMKRARLATSSLRANSALEKPNKNYIFTYLEKIWMFIQAKVRVYVVSMWFPEPKFLKAHQTVIKELATIKVDCGVASRWLHKVQKVALEHTTKTTANGQLVWEEITLHNSRWQ